MSDQSPEQIAAGLIASLLRLPRVESPRQDGPLGEAGARLRALVAELVAKLDAVHDDPQYKGVWTLAHVHGYNYTGLTYTKELQAVKEALLAAPVVSPPLPVCKECGCQTGGGEYCYEHKPYTVSPLKDGTFRVDRFGMQRISFEEPPSAPVVSGSHIVDYTNALPHDFQPHRNGGRCCVRCSVDETAHEAKWNDGKCAETAVVTQEGESPCP
jgi:hypothetical protein